MIHALLQSSSIKIREFACVLRTIVSCFPGNTFGPLHYRYLELDKIQAVKSRKGNYEKPMSLSSLARHDLQWWVNNITTMYAHITHKPISLELTTDASNSGWGAA